MKNNKQQTTKVSFCATENNTNNWVLLIDGLFGFVDEKIGKEIYEKINNIEDSPFGCMQLIKPNHVPIDYKGNVITKNKISEHKDIDIINYYNKRIVRNNKRLFTYLCSPKISDYKRRKEFTSIFNLK